MADPVQKKNYFDKPDGYKANPKDTRERKTLEALEEFPAIAIPPRTFKIFSENMGQRIQLDRPDLGTKAPETLRGDEAQKLIAEMKLPFKDPTLTVQRDKYNNHGAGDQKGPYRIEAYRIQVFLPNQKEPIARAHQAVLTYGELKNGKFAETERLVRTTASYKEQGQSDYKLMLTDEVFANQQFSGSRKATIDRGGMGGTILYQGGLLLNNRDSEFKIDKNGKPVVSDLKTSMLDPQGKDALTQAEPQKEHPFAALVEKAKMLDVASTRPATTGGLPADLKNTDLALATGSLKK